MSLNYDDLKKKHESEGSQWTSYSDLFMVLSFVFLLLYVVASLRSGTVSITAQVKVQATQEEIEELREQLKVFNEIKENFFEVKGVPVLIFILSLISISSFLYYYFLLNLMQQMIRLQ